MLLRGIGMTIEGAEGAKSPPLPHIEVEDHEGAALLALYPKGLRDVTNDGAEAPEVEAPAEPATPTPTEVAPAPEADAAPAPEEPAPLVADDAAAPADAEAGDEELDAEEAARLAGGTHPEDMTSALELIEDADLVAAGPRKGKPKVSAIAAILGREVTSEEIDAAWAAKESAA